MSFNNRGIVRRSNLENEDILIVHPDNPLANLPESHPLYGRYIASTQDPSVGSDLIELDSVSIDIDNLPTTSDGNLDIVVGASLETPTNISVDLVNYSQNITKDGSVFNTVYASFDEVNGADEYRVRYVQL